MALPRHIGNRSRSREVLEVDGARSDGVRCLCDNEKVRDSAFLPSDLVAHRAPRSVLSVAVVSFTEKTKFKNALTLVKNVNLQSRRCLFCYSKSTVNALSVSCCAKWLLRACGFADASTVVF